MPQAFITGVTGQDGSYLAERLAIDGWQVHGLVRKGVTGEQELPNGVIAHEGDLRDHAGLARLVREVRPQLIVNLAGLSSVAASWERPAEAAEISGSSVAALLDAAQELSDDGASVRFVQASSSEIFGIPSDDPQTEDTRISPVSPYGAAKAFGHHLVGVYRSRGLHASSAILYNHESPRRPETFVTRKITASVARIALGLQDRLVLGNVDAIRDWGWAPDYMDAITRISGAAAPDDYIVATGEAHSVREFVEAAFSSAGLGGPGSRLESDPSAMRPTDAPRMRGDSSRLRTQLGWAPTMSFTDIVDAMIAEDLRVQAVARSGPGR